jgi:hypothetical protein
VYVQQNPVPIATASLGSRLDARFRDVSQKRTDGEEWWNSIVGEQNKYQVKDSQISLEDCAWGINALDYIW